MEIREARSGDVPAITAIYNEAVENTTAIWNDRTVDEENRHAWLAQRTGDGFPVLVAVDKSSESAGDSDGGAGRAEQRDGHRATTVLGYATYGQWRPFDGYRHTVEHSVYVAADGRGRGTGRALMEAIIEHARRAGVHAMVAGVDAENAASLGLHEALGFRAVGRLDQVGTKFGRWLDLAFLQLTLDADPAPPS